MYDLNCPQCETINSVTAAKAGGEVACAQCQHSIAVPKLGELKQLPVSQTASDASRSETASGGLSGGRSMAFAALGAVGLLCFLAAAFCGVNWATIDVPATSETHLSGLKERYAISSSARLIREYEDITKYGVSVPQPFVYRTIELNKQAWGNKTAAFGGAGLLCAVVSVFVGRKK